MLRLKAERPRLGVICTSVFRHTAVLLFLTCHCGGQSQVFGPSQPIVAAVGDDITLPCQLEPAVDASDLTVEWSRPELNPRFVHVWRDGVELESKKHPSYEGRTSVSINKLKHGDVSLKLYRLKPSDEGTYRCFIPTLNTRSTVELVVGRVSSLIIRLMRPENDGHISRVVLNCESEGWYPEPEVLWLDGEGNLLSAGPAETVRGPDDLYTVSSRVTVEKRHSNRFTCRVQQKDINQTREAHIQVPDNIFTAPCTSAPHITISLIVVFMVFFAAAFAVWRWKRKRNIAAALKTKTTLSNNSELLLNEKEEEALQIFTDSTETKDLDKKKAKLDVQLKKMEEERIDVVGLVNILMNQKKDLEEQIYHTREELNEVERQTHENHQLLSPTEPTNQAENNMKHNEKQLLDTKTNLDLIKKELEKKVQDKNTVLKSILCGVAIITEWKKELDIRKEKIHKHLEEMEELR